MNHKLQIPADVPSHAEQEFIENYATITRNSTHLFLFACDQKLEHLHDAFDPNDPAIDAHALNPDHLFQIASHGDIGAMATQLELIARYGKQYPTVNYIAKLNSKTNLIPAAQKDPISAPLWTVKDVVQLKKDAQLLIHGIGITIYLGSEFENEMLSFASKSIFQAHQHGLVALLWMYPRGQAVKDDTDAHLLAGAAGAANALGADFVKIKAPADTHAASSAEQLKEIVAAAGNTRVICAGGAQTDITSYLTAVSQQMTIGGTAGTATGRNIFQRALPEAISMTRALSAIVYQGASPENALKFIIE